MFFTKKEKQRDKEINAELERLQSKIGIMSAVVPLDGRTMVSFFTKEAFDDATLAYEKEEMLLKEKFKVRGRIMEGVKTGD